MVVSRKISLKTGGLCDIINITPQIVKEVAETGINSGIAALFVAGSTAGLTTIEFEAGLIDDFKNMWNRVIPKDIPYRHDQAWGEGNGFSHVRASLLGASLTIPFTNKALTLGTWQQIVLVDFDNRPRSREIIVQVIGE